MILKKRAAPIQLLGLEAIMRRSKYVTDEMRSAMSKRQIGFKGECSIDYYLDQLTHFLILHDLRLPAKPYGYVQIDTLLLCKQGMIILEVKNYQGVIQFDKDSHQVLRILHEKEERIPNPLIQTSRQQNQLDSFLVQNGWPSLPISTYVVYSSPLTLLRYAPSRVIHAEAIPLEMDTFLKKTKREYLSQKQIEQVASLLSHSHLPASSNQLKLFGLDSTSIQSGVHCIQCNKLTMTRPRRIRKWTCENCSFTSKYAHIPTLQDYALLFQPTIKNHQARDFLNLPTTTIAHYLLKNLNVRTTGKNKGRTYHIPIPFEMDH
ncbi:nuclease-related domain-containing protein [Alkalicoccobacillus murimartini]|uniref:NERD domain-containing protein n=1 Tax=Alkalicoccobacillus murimartini TaxID=171685 RepID=A0ABT9YCV1_9BACI|nr:nuclease-related domain-containing protein [Alkalicoccobacillus murimartini]MDQ0205305.1 hypothetical protein [Alkalicoccobacillus murimartini]